jgi:hypothetical protein
LFQFDFVLARPATAALPAQRAPIRMASFILNLSTTYNI